ncbi:hypothetical protein [Methylobacterium fujisawaense]|uniref:hypothetical protein n=1 Tax=Methylobacterium fujisawaense TaxID=107400 RepID=UPI00313E2CD6
MFGPKKGGVFAGKGGARDTATGVFKTVTGPGLGKAATMDRGVFDKAVKSANTALRETKFGVSGGVNGRKR